MFCSFSMSLLLLILFLSWFTDVNKATLVIKDIKFSCTSSEGDYSVFSTDVVSLL